MCTALDVAGHHVFFTDDSPHKLHGAIELGMTVHHYVGVRPLRLALNAAGLPISH